jgi:hypothetical protein
LSEAESNTWVKVQLEGLGQIKIPVSSLGTKTATFQLVAQSLNQLRYLVVFSLSVFFLFFFKGIGHLETFRFILFSSKIMYYLPISLL